MKIKEIKLEGTFSSHEKVKYLGIPLQHLVPERAEDKEVSSSDKFTSLFVTLKSLHSGDKKKK